MRRLALAAVLLLGAAASRTTLLVGVWEVHMTDVYANDKTGDFHTDKPVHITRKGGDITADRASGNYKANKATLFGHVIVHDSQGAAIPGANPLEAHEPATLTSDQLAIDGAAKSYVATGNVHYVSGDTIADSQRGRLDDGAHVLFLDGDVNITRGAMNMRNAQHVTYDTLTHKIHAEGAQATMQLPAQGGGFPSLARPTVSP